MKTVNTKSFTINAFQSEILTNNLLEQMSKSLKEKLSEVAIDIPRQKRVSEPEIKMHLTENTSRKVSTIID